MENRVCYSGIDVFKFVMALLVVAAHTRPFYGINPALDFFICDVMGRITVPFFFAASGFLLEQQIKAGKSREQTEGDAGKRKRDILSKYVRKVFALYLLWSAVYLPVIVWDKFIDSGDTLLRGVFTVVRDFVFVGSYSHLWYLLAAAVSTVLVYTLRKYLGEGKTCAILLLLFCMGLLTQSYFGLFAQIVSADGIIWKGMTAVKKVMVTCRNGVFFGAVFLYMGTWIAGHDRKIRQWKTGAGFLVSVLFFAVEVVVLFDSGYVREQDMFLMQLPCAFFLLLFAAGLPVEADTGMLRKMSMNIYYVHLYFKFVYRKLLPEDSKNHMGLFVFVLAGALLTSYVMCRAKKEEKT